MFRFILSNSLLGKCATRDPMRLLDTIRICIMHAEYVVPSRANGTYPGVSFCLVDVGTTKDRLRLITCTIMAGRVSSEPLPSTSEPTFTPMLTQRISPARATMESASRRSIIFFIGCHRSNSFWYPSIETY